jgi:hypothetical protein
MPIEYFPAPDPSWEPLYDQAPIAMLDRHPSSEFVALRVTYLNGAAVWRTDTKRLAWHRDQALALSWTPDGSEVVLVRDDFQHQPELHNLFERYTWPGGEYIEGTKLTLPTGWVEDIVVTPSGHLAAVKWVDQTESGVEIVYWKAGPPKQVEGAGFYGASSIMAPPTFSPDSRYLETCSVVKLLSAIWRLKSIASQTLWLALSQSGCPRTQSEPPTTRSSDRPSEARIHSPYLCWNSASKSFQFTTGGYGSNATSKDVPAVV